MAVPAPSSGCSQAWVCFGSYTNITFSFISLRWYCVFWHWPLSGCLHRGESCTKLVACEAVCIYGCLCSAGGAIAELFNFYPPQLREASKSRPGTMQSQADKDACIRCYMFAVMSIISLVFNACSFFLVAYFLWRQNPERKLDFETHFFGYLHSLWYLELVRPVRLCCAELRFNSKLQPG